MHDGQLTKSFHSLRNWLVKIIAKSIGEEESHLALPVLTGPGRGLWFRESATATVNEQRNFSIAVLSKICQPGWTIWDCACPSDSSSVAMAKFVGQDGFVVAFEPDRSRFLETYDNAVLNGCSNILFLFAAVGHPHSRPRLSPPIQPRHLSLDEAYQDDEIPVPQLVRMNLSGFDNPLHHAGRLIKEQRPWLLLENWAPKECPEVLHFAQENRYDLRNIEGELIANPTEMASSPILLTPKPES